MPMTTREMQPTLKPIESLTVEPAMKLNLAHLVPRVHKPPPDNDGGYPPLDAAE